MALSGRLFRRWEPRVGTTDMPPHVFQALRAQALGGSLAMITSTARKYSVATQVCVHRYNPSAAIFLSNTELYVCT